MARATAIRIQQLKDKLGNRSNASSEVEFQDAWGVLVGEEGRGIPTIIEMAAHDAAELRAGQCRHLAHGHRAGPGLCAPASGLWPVAGHATG